MARVLRLLKAELRTVMAIGGTRALADIGADSVMRAT